MYDLAFWMVKRSQDRSKDECLHSFSRQVRFHDKVYIMISRNHNCNHTNMLSERVKILTELNKNGIFNIRFIASKDMRESSHIFGVKIYRNKKERLLILTARLSQTSRSVFDIFLVMQTSIFIDPIYPTLFPPFHLFERNMWISCALR